MKHKNHDQMTAENGEQENGMRETVGIEYTDIDKDKGNLKNFNISKKIIKKLKAHNIECLLSVQRDTYTNIHEENDCLVQASNGSGRTFAYVIPLVQLIQYDNAIELTEGRAPRVLVLTATRDSAKAIAEEFQSIVNDLSIATVFKSKKKIEDQDTLIANGCDVVVATPDRLKEFVDEEKIDLTQLKHVVLDDIDRMIDENMTEDVKSCLKSAFTSEQEKKPQLIVFTQSMPDSIQKVTKKYFATDFNTINTIENGAQQTQDDDDSDDDNDDSNESFKITTKKNGQQAQNGSTPGVSLLSQQENYTTYQLTGSDEIKGAGFVFTMLRKCFGDEFDAKGIVSKIAYTTDFRSAVFDIPSEYDEQIKTNWKNTQRIQMVPITKLPELDQSSMNDSKGSYGNKNQGYGGGNRASGRSNACFNCQKEGHKSFECPEGNSGKGQRGNGNKFGGGGGGGGGGGCFNCGKDGHKSFECPEPKKSGGRGGGERSNACFNCGKDGHKSFECTEPKKSGGRPNGGERSNACFNCGKDGHKSFDCPEPKKGRPSGGGRGGRGGGNGPKRNYGSLNDNGNGNHAGETSNKKIKFDDDDDE